MIFALYTIRKNFIETSQLSFLKTTMSQFSNIPTVKNFINGVFEDSKTDKWIDVLNPATQELVCRVPMSTQEELTRAEHSCAEAYKTWREVPVQQRQRIFFNLQALVRDHTDEIAKCITLEQGKTLTDAKGNQPPNSLTVHRFHQLTYKYITFNMYSIY